MAGFLRQSMVWLGLTDDEYDDVRYDSRYDNRYDEPQQAANTAPNRTPGMRTMPDIEPVQTVSAVRTLTSEEVSGSSGVTMTSRPVVRAMSANANARVHVVEPQGFADAQEIGDRLRSNEPVIITLQTVDPELSRRLIDFCSGSTYVLGGKMERVARNVFLLTPSNVEVSAEERRRLSEQGYQL